jgi:hypothetical protein
MRSPWGRLDTAGTWPNPKPVRTLAACLLAIVSAVAVGDYRYHAATPLQQLYLPVYLRSTIASHIGFRAVGRYQLLTLLDRRGLRLLALDDRDVEPAIDSAGSSTWALTDAAIAAGERSLAWQNGDYDHVKLHALLGRFVYGDETLTDLAMPAVWSAAGVGIMALLVAVPKDAARGRERRHGRRLKGPELVSVGQFTRRTRATGLGWVQASSRVAHLFGWPPRVLRIPHTLEASHVLLMGDSGTGKSLLIRQVLEQIEARGETAIVYDPAREFTPQFYTPARGDAILNPLDVRCPYWSPAEEVRHEAEALTVATSLFPDKPDDSHPFFTEAPRRIFSHLLTLGPSPQDLAQWLCDEDELDRLLAGTPYAKFIGTTAPEQRTGVLSALNMVADALNLLPTAQETTGRWSAAAWSDTRRGWLFLTSAPGTRERLKPLLSLWLDTLVLRLMDAPYPDHRPVWFVLDELQTLQRLPQLHTAVTENRKFGNPLVLGFQGRSQLESRYGLDAEAMLSQPATKIFLRTSEAHAAKWIADTIGEIEVDRLAETRSKGPARQQSYGLERHVEPLVMASEMTGLPNLHGYLKQGNLVVRLQVPYVAPHVRHPDLVLRRSRPRPPHHVPPSTSTPSVVADEHSVLIRDSSVR